MRFAHCGLLLAGLLVIMPGVVRGQEFEALVKRVPAGANTLVLLNVEKILQSPVALRENWKAKHEQAYAEGLSVLPADVKQAVFASEMDLDAMAPVWESVVMRLDGVAQLDALAGMSGGRQEMIGKYPVVALPTNAYAVQFAPDIVGAMTPAGRQLAGRWIRETEASPAAELSPYLAEAFGYANNLGTPIILAIDLQDVDTPEEVLALLKASDLFANKPDVDLPRLAQTIAGIRGLTLGITLAEQTFGKVKVDFTDDLGLSPELAKAALLHAARPGAANAHGAARWTPRSMAGK